MTSILKVDTIQKPDGTAPSASELGIVSSPLTSADMPSGSVVQVKQHTWSTTFSTTSGSMVDVTDSFFNFTPKFSDSILYVFMDVHLYWPASLRVGGAIVLKHNGAFVAEPSVQHEIYHDVTGSSETVYDRVVKNLSVLSSSTATRSIGIGVKRHSGTMYVNYVTSNTFTSSITVMEIAQ